MTRRVSTRTWISLWSIALTPILLSMGFSRTMGSDLWWMIASGDWMRANGQVVSKDSFSFTFAGSEWLHHEWLSSWTYSWMVDSFGVESLVVWKWIIILAIYLTLFRVLVMLSGGNRLIPAFGTILAILPAAPLLDIRPHLYSLLGYSLVLLLYWSGEKTRWFIPLVVAFWVNLHGGYIFALMVLTILLAVDLFHGKTDWKVASALLGSSTLATLLNPYGYKIHSFPLAYAMGGENPYRQNLLEWQPGFWGAEGIRSPLGPALAILFLVASCSLLVKKWRPTDPKLYSAFALSLLTFGMAIQARRFVSFFALSLVLFLIPRLVQRLKKQAPRLEAAGATLVLFIGTSLLWTCPIDRGLFGYLTSLDYCPTDVCDFMEVNKIEGKVFAFYSYGGYLHMRGKGKWTVFIDGRADTVYSRAHFRDYNKVVTISEGWNEVIESSRADYFLWPLGDQESIRRMLSTGHWKALYSDSVSILLSRSEFNARQLRPPDLSAARLSTLALAKGRAGRFREFDQHLEQAWQLYPTIRQIELLRVSIDKRPNTGSAKKLLRERRGHFPGENRLMQFLYAETDRKTPKKSR